MAKIIEASLSSPLKEEDLRDCIVREAFSESVFSILPALKSGRWPLLKEDFSPVLRHVPSRPLTLLEKRWLKAIAQDPRVRLFDVKFPALDDVEPLFGQEDYRIYDRYGDGDAFEDATYIRHFRKLLRAMREQLPVSIGMTDRYGKKIRMQFYPKIFEYSEKDDKIRVIAQGGKYRQFNLGRILSCDIYRGNLPRIENKQTECRSELTLRISNKRNALERVMLHFAHFEKEAERMQDGTYLLRLQYEKKDESEMVIRVLSFGPCVQALEPPHFVELIKKRLLAQKNCRFR